MSEKRKIKEVHMTGDILEDDFIDLLNSVLEMHLFNTMPGQSMIRVIGVVTAKLLLENFKEDKLHEVVDAYAVTLKKVIDAALEGEKDGKDAE